MLGDIISAVGKGLDFINAQKNRDAAARQAAAQQQLQLDFAKSGIQWKVEDAKAAGIHPLAALGTTGPSYSPISLGDAGAPASNFSGMGQDIGKAISRSQEKEDALATAGAKLDLEAKQLNNDLLRSRIAQLNSEGRSGGIPTSGRKRLVAGQGDTPALKLQGQEVVVGPPGDRSRELEHIPDTAYIDTGTGYAPTPGKATKERIEDDWIQQSMWALRNNILPSIGMRRRPPPNVPISENEVWRYDRLNQQYVKKPRHKRSPWHFSITRE